MKDNESPNAEMLSGSKDAALGRGNAKRTSAARVLLVLAVIEIVWYVLFFFEIAPGPIHGINPIVTTWLVLHYVAVVFAMLLTGEDSTLPDWLLYAVVVAIQMLIYTVLLIAFRAWGRHRDRNAPSAGQ